MAGKLKHFEVSLYNSQVRELVQKNKEHPNFNRDWANLHFLTYKAENKNEVIEQVRKRHPERKGFVIDKIVEVREYEFAKLAGQR